MNLPPYVFDVDYVTKTRSGLSITVLEKKMHKIIAWKKWPYLLISIGLSFWVSLLRLGHFLVSSRKSTRYRKTTPVHKNLIHSKTILYFFFSFYHFTNMKIISKGSSKGLVIKTTSLVAESVQFMLDFLCFFIANGAFDFVDFSSLQVLGSSIQPKNGCVRKLYDTNKEHLHYIWFPIRRW